MHPYVNNSPIYSSQGKETMQISINSVMNKENAVHMYNVIILIKKEWNNAIDATGDYHTKWSKSEKQNTIWYHLYVEFKIWHELIYKTDT